MAERYRRFVESSPNAIQIVDARALTDELIRSNPQEYGFAFHSLMSKTEDEAEKLLDSENGRNGVMKEAWQMAKENLPNLDIPPGDKISSLSESCKLAVHAYSLEDPPLFKHFNTDSRTAIENSAWENFQYKGMWLLLYKAYNKCQAVFETPLCLYRGASVEFSVDVGSQIMFKAFTSTTGNRQVAENFASEGSSGSLFIMEVSSAFDIQKLSLYGDEEEFLLPPNTGFDVMDVKEKGSLREIYLKDAQKCYPV